MMEAANYDDFTKLDLRVGTIISVSEFPKAIRPAFKIRVDFGSEIGVLNSSAQITDLYCEESLLGKQIIAIVNFPPKQIANFISQCLILGAVDADKKVVLLKPDTALENGLRIL